VDPAADQFNSIWEGLIAKWGSLKDEGYVGSGVVHFAAMDAIEDLMTTAVLMDTAAEVGIEPRFLYMNEIGWDAGSQCFVDRGFDRIRTLFKLYPWEWLVNDEFGKHAIATYSGVDWIEPIWKMLLSNKALLPLLWEMYPGHPNLVPAFDDGPRGMTRFVKKPTLGREGANVEIWADEAVQTNPGDYSDGAFVWQEYVPLPVFDGNHAVIGSWVIDGEARGVGVRESDGSITQDLARFVPHYFYNPATSNAVTYP
jgi:glutathionylspermidine synthase